MSSNIKTGWMSFSELEPYLAQLITMESDLLVTYHYPDRPTPTKYIERSVRGIEQHLANGNTYFYGIRDDETLYGYLWAYTATFIDELRWNEHSRYLREEYRGEGYGKLMSEEGEKMARSLGVASMSAHVASFNERMKRLLSESDYEVARVEMVKKL